jgi:hypothetical protein
MTSRLRRTPADWPLACRAALLLIVTAVCVRVAPRWTLQRASCVRAARHRQWTLERIMAVVSTLGRVPGLRGSCLTRGITGLVLARRAGLDPTLVIGVSRSGPSLAAHAWLEHAGVIVPAQHVDAYVPMWSSR